MRIRPNDTSLLIIAALCASGLTFGCQTSKREPAWKSPPGGGADWMAYHNQYKAGVESATQQMQPKPKKRRWWWFAKREKKPTNPIENMYRQDKKRYGDDPALQDAWERTLKSGRSDALAGYRSKAVNKKP